MRVTSSFSHRGDHVLWLGVSLALLSACTNALPSQKPVSATNHPWFPLQSGAHALNRTMNTGATVTCETCHPTSTESFRDFTCIECHGHEQSTATLLHHSVADFTFTAQSCVTCHPAGERVPFDHAGVTNQCATCHEAREPFAALPLVGRDHPARGAIDCGVCHTTASWKGAAGVIPTGLSSDSAHDLAVDTLLPTFSGTSIVRMSPQTQTLPMHMSHAAPSIASAISQCSGCHTSIDTGSFFPGVFHDALSGLNVSEPQTCGACHVNAAPKGFVGPVDTGRSPAAGAMRHDAVEWDAGFPTSVAAVTQDCGTCHSSRPSAAGRSWKAAVDGGALMFHNAGQTQPGTCLDCHANSRRSAALDGGITFAHETPVALGDCAGCHIGTRSWAGGTYHRGQAAPASCLPCHEGQRPTSTSAWKSTTWAAKPFDAVTNAAGITHGAGLDCVTCHTNTSTWEGGSFTHGPTTASANTCIACHSTQRPDLLTTPTPAAVAALIGFDHNLNGRGECFACHQATVTRNSYERYFNASNTFPGGDWEGGQEYPGSTFAASLSQFITVQQMKLNRSAATGLVTSTSKSNATYFNGMLHVSPQVPAALNAGPSNAADQSVCWHCHTNTNGTVTSYAAGVFHQALTDYRATFNGTPAPFPQPTTGCDDCHLQMRPANIVAKNNGVLEPMDHAARFTAPTQVGGKLVSSVSELDCSTCHHLPGDSWNDGVFHTSIATAHPADCVTCHYPLMASPALSDSAATTGARMKHASTQLTTQSCETCHLEALARAKTPPPAASQFDGGIYHAALSTQPTGCLECHAASTPTSSTASTTSYTLAQGATATNQPQWMNHASASVSVKDCASCHANDAKPAGAVWSTSTPLHSQLTVNTCRECHGTTNGNGTTLGTKNNVPQGATDATTVTTASAGTGVAPQTKAQLAHADANVTSRDCNACHTQVGAAAAAPVKGKEWAQARFHQNVPAMASGTRCSSCHINERPTAAFTAFDHSGFTAATTSQDCGSCHVFPGTGNSSAPNWLGAASVPPFITVGGFTIPSPPAATPTIQPGIANLPHPSTTTQACTACHASAAGGTSARGYDHASTLINTACNTCHESGSNLVSVVWNGATQLASGAGDTRAISLTSLRVTYSGNSLTVSNPNHFYPADCSQCHVKPTGNGVYAPGTTYTTAWKFNHKTVCPKMTNPTTCNFCHAGRHSKCD